MIGEDLRQAVLAREDVRRLYEPPDGDPAALARIEGYLEELRATQRHSIYRALKHPLYPILRKVERVAEGLPHLRQALDTGRVVYVSNHKSHLDYLVELLILEDFGLRPPIIAAGINLFGGALGLLHKHVTGAIPIRRGARDAAYLVTLKAFVAELLQSHDLFFYPEGGRSYSGELKTAKTGLFNAVVMAEVPVLHIVPVAIAYDLVLEDRILAPQVTKGRQRPFSRELAEMVGTAVGYQSRAFVTFGAPVTLAGGEARSRRDVMDLAHTVISAVGRLHKVLPTALVATVMRPSMPRGELVTAVQGVIDRLAASGANLGTTNGAEAVEQALALFEERGVLQPEGDIIRVRDRFVLRYYARQLKHLLAPGAFLVSRMIDAISKAAFGALAGSVALKRLASRYGMRGDGGFARRFVAGEDIDEAIAAARSVEAQGLSQTLDLLGESVASEAEARAATNAYLAMMPRIAEAGIGRNISIKLTQLGLDLSPAVAGANLESILGRARDDGFFVRVDMENSPYVEATLTLVEAAWRAGLTNVGVVLQSALKRSEIDLERVLALGMRVRLVKGAYKEPASLAWQSKSEVDAAYVRMLERLLAQGQFPAIATHDPAMITETRRIATVCGLASSAFEFQMLYGVRRDLQAALTREGFGVRVYIPYGREWFPYFMRRLGERPANVGFVLKSLIHER